MGPAVAKTTGEGSPQESAGVPTNTRERARKKANRAHDQASRVKRQPDIAVFRCRGVGKPLTFLLQSIPVRADQP